MLITVRNEVDTKKTARLLFHRMLEKRKERKRKRKGEGQNSKKGSTKMNANCES